MNRFLCNYCRQVKYEDWSDKLLDQFTCNECLKIKRADTMSTPKQILVKNAKEDRRTRAYKSTELGLNKWMT